MDSPRHVTVSPWSNNKSCKPRHREGSLKTSIQKLKKNCDVQFNSRTKNKGTGLRHFIPYFIFISNHNQSNVSEQQLRSQVAKIAGFSRKHKKGTPA